MLRASNLALSQLTVNQAGSSQMGLTTVVGMNQTQELKQLEGKIEDVTTCNYNSQIEGREIMI